jgi:hypothetical protein
MQTPRLLTLPVLLALVCCGDAAIELPQQLTVLHVAPHHGATNVALDVSIEIGFNDALERDSVDSQSARVEHGGDALQLSRSFEAQQRQLILLPEDPLEPDTEYEIYLDDELTGRDTGPLGTPVRTRFRTAL